MTFRDLTLADAVAVSAGMRPEDRDCLAAVAGGCNAEAFAINRFQSDGAAWTLLQDGEPVAILGLSSVSPWAVNAWLIATPAMSRQSWKKLLRFARTVRDNALQKTRRIECMVLSTWPKAAGFAESLGFELEGVKRNAGKGGEDVLLYAILGKASA